MEESEQQKPNPNYLWDTASCVLLPVMPAEDVCGSSNRFTPSIGPFKPRKRARQWNGTQWAPTLTTAPVYFPQRLSFSFAERPSGFLTTQSYLLKSNVRISKPVMFLPEVAPRDPTALQICQHDFTHQACTQNRTISRDRPLTKANNEL